MAETSSGVPPGWYGDQAGQLRWWDGQQWGPAAPYQPWQQGSSGYTLAVFGHLGFILGGFLVPLVLHLASDESDRFTRSHTSEALNAQLTWLCLFFPLFIASFAVTNRGTRGEPTTFTDHRRGRISHDRERRSCPGDGVGLPPGVDEP